MFKYLLDHDEEIFVENLSVNYKLNVVLLDLSLQPLRHKLGDVAVAHQ